MRVDYVVATTEDMRRATRWGTVLRNRDARIARYLYGYRGEYLPDEQAFVGVQHPADGPTRWMLAVAGAPADGWVEELGDPDGVSVARLDIQHTVVVPDADRAIRQVVATGRYKQYLLDPAPGRGVTRYIGAPSSIRRARLYNKSVQSGVYPEDGGEYARLELQLRNYRADDAYAALYRGDRHTLAAHGRAVLEQMCTLPRELQQWSVDSIELPARPAAERAYAVWLRQTVLPALSRIAISDPELYTEFREALPEENGDGKWH